MTTAYGTRTGLAKPIVSLTASKSNTPGRQGMMASVAQRIASVTLADKFGAVSMNTHSTPSPFAVLRSSAKPRCALLSGSESFTRSLFHSASEPCGSPSMRRQGATAYGHERRDERPTCFCLNRPYAMQRRVHSCWNSQTIPTAHCSPMRGVLH
jgi:hypothetical protein